MIELAPRIRVAGIVLARQNDGTYTANVKRSETSLTEGEKSESGWIYRNVRVPWDVRIGQEWLARFPTAWEPA
jgi:hypothetical protein